MTVDSRYFHLMFSFTRNTWKFSICGAGKGWRSVGPIVCKMKYYVE